MVDFLFKDFNNNRTPAGSNSELEEEKPNCKTNPADNFSDLKQDVIGRKKFISLLRIIVSVFY